MRKALQPSTDLLISKINIWCENKKNTIKNEEDLERAIELICETARTFGASTLEIGKTIPLLQEKRIMETIAKIKKEKKFKVQKVTELLDHAVVGWVLTKYNSGNRLSIELMKENYIHVCGNDWNLFAYGYHTLATAIHCWAEGRM